MNIHDLLEQRKQAILAADLDRADLIARALAGDEAALKEVEGAQTEETPADSVLDKFFEGLAKHERQTANTPAGTDPGKFFEGAHCGGCCKIVPFSACYEEFGRNWLNLKGKRRCKDCRKVEKAAETLSTPVWYAIDDLGTSPSDWFMSEAEAVKYAEKNLRPGQEYRLKTYRVADSKVTTERRRMPEDDVEEAIRAAEKYIRKDMKGMDKYPYKVENVVINELLDRLLRHLEDEADDMVAQNWRPEDRGGR